MRSRRNAAFTMVELMIVIAIIGVLASVAVPGFVKYQMTSKRAEAFTNLRGLATSQKAFYGEWGSYVDSAPEPWNTSGIAPSRQKRAVSALTAAFSGLGWTPEGDVYYDYDSCSSAGTAGCSCTCPTCFTVSAWGDLDDDGSRSAVQYYEPSVSGASCPSAYFGWLPPVDSNGNDILQTVVVRIGVGTDDF